MPSVDKSFCRTVCIDFDGTIVNEAYPEIGAIKENAKAVINKIAEKYSVLVLTNRVSPAVHSMDEVGKQQYLLDNWKKANGLNIDGFVGYKPRAIIFIDNNALRFDDISCNWDKINEILEVNKII